MSARVNCATDRPATPVINGHTRLIAHIGHPTGGFTAPMIYNPYFASVGLNAVVVPMGVIGEDFVDAFRSISRFTNFHGALITMPHKATAAAYVNRISVAARIAGACNAVRRAGDGALEGDMFDGSGFVRGLQRNGCIITGAKALVVGAGGAGSAIAASLAAAGVGSLTLFDPRAGIADALADRLRQYFPMLALDVSGRPDPSGFGIVVNASPLGSLPDDPLPFDPTRLSAGAFVGDVVLTSEATPLIRAARERGCGAQPGADMLFEQIPAYLDFFGFPVATSDQLRVVARLE